MENSTSTSISNPFVLISLISWILVLITGWLSFFVPNLDGVFIFMNHAIATEGDNPFPLFMYKVFFYILAIILLFSLTVSFSFMFIIYFKQKMKMF